jgi:hypothetical protein
MIDLDLTPSTIIREDPALCAVRPLSLTRSALSVTHYMMDAGNDL